MWPATAGGKGRWRGWSWKRTRPYSGPDLPWMWRYLGAGGGSAGSQEEGGAGGRGGVLAHKKVVALRGWGLEVCSKSTEGAGQSKAESWRRPLGGY